MFRSVLSLKKKHSRDERRFDYLRQYLASACDNVFGHAYDGSGEEIESRVRTMRGGLLAYEVVMIFRHRDRKDEGKVTGISGYRKEWRLGSDFDEKMTRGSRVIDISDNSGIQDAASRIFTQLRENDSLASALRKY